MVNSNFRPPTPEERKASKDKLMSDINTLPDRQRKFIQSIPSQFHSLFYKVYTGQASRPDCIKAKCIDCSAFQKPEINLCASTNCPLYSIRPYQSRDTATLDDTEDLDIYASLSSSSSVK